MTLYLQFMVCICMSKGGHQDTGYPAPLYSALLSPELGWWPPSPSEPPIFIPDLHHAGVTGVHMATPSFFRWVLRIWTQVFMHGQQVLFSTKRSLQNCYAWFCLRNLNCFTVKHFWLSHSQKSWVLFSGLSQPWPVWDLLQPLWTNIFSLTCSRTVSGLLYFHHVPLR